MKRKRKLKYETLERKVRTLNRQLTDIREKHYDLQRKFFQQEGLREVNKDLALTNWRLRNAAVQLNKYESERAQMGIELRRVQMIGEQ